ncbi:hypothetical protein BofuT4_P134070.1 [Botrytis cinerea T4]|uniref:Uncharacterized protein n=1 Tax=Botryotinia fuckeliana (strain T4) TaxID=999810 RepID=G2YQF5_BOTF4|nr:hypothetical protein BofuT4_P134070.1 [Botrytis cinerea T4]
MAFLAADISKGAKIRTVKIDSKRSFHQGFSKNDSPELLNLRGGIVVVPYTPSPTLQHCDIDLMSTSNAVPHRLELFRVTRHQNCHSSWHAMSWISASDLQRISQHSLYNFDNLPMRASFVSKKAFLTVLFSISRMECTKPSNCFEFLRYQSFAIEGPI